MSILSACLLLALASTQPPNAVETKDITAPPEDILSGRVVLPAPAASPTVSWSALIPLDDLREDELVLRPGPGKAMVGLLAVDADRWGLGLVSTDGSGRDRVLPSEFTGVEALLPEAVARTVIVPEDAVEARVVLKRPEDATPAWMLLGDGQDALQLRTWLGTRSTLLGSTVALHAALDGGTLLEGTVRLRDPDGLVRLLPLEAEGPLDVARFLADRTGDWTVHTVVRARDAEGVERLRSTQQIMRVVRPELTFSGEASLRPSDDGSIRIDLPVTLLAQGETSGSRRVAIGCEVWGRTDEGLEVPVCWVARMHQLPAAGGRATCDLRLDPRWIARAGVDPGTLNLRELRAHDAGGFVLLDHEPRPETGFDGPIDGAGTPVAAVTEDMLRARSGRAVQGLPAPTTGLQSPGGHVLLVSHGYCTDLFPWQTSDFSGDLELYEQYGANNSHDTFALDFESRGRAWKSMGIVGHSQGGNAAAHLFTFYWSALDWPTGDRRIQGVGVPWLGTALAGNAAVLGEVFGVGCGTNYDLTYEGSAAWLSFIPTWVRQDVWYWTTSFTDGWFYDYCQIVTDVLLSDPDDGTVERYAGQLEGANNGGHKTGWCHIRLMRDPPQCRDAARNVELSEEAAR